MTVVSMSETRKVTLPRSGPVEFWRLVREHYAGESELRWKYLAMLALRVNAGWPVDIIGSVFGHDKGHVSRCLRHVKRDLRQQFQPDDEYLSLPDADQLDAMLQEEAELMEQLSGQEAGA